MPDDDEKPNDNLDEYLYIANRGGLTKPSDMVFMACVHAWPLNVTISEYGEASNLLMQSTNPHLVFMYCYTEELQLLMLHVLRMFWLIKQFVPEWSQACVAFEKNCNGFV